MAIMIHAKFHLNWLMLTLIFGIWASEPPRAWRTTEKAGPDRVKCHHFRCSIIAVVVGYQLKHARQIFEINCSLQ